MEAEPSSRVSMPLEIESVAANPVQASERRVKILRLRSLADRIDSAGRTDSGFHAIAEDVDWVVELSGFDCR
jgi:hypothetical protein